MMASIAQQQAQQQNAIAQQQLKMAQDQYAHVQPQLDQINDAELKGMTQQNEAAAQDRARYESTFVPLQDQYIQTANNWDTPEREQSQAGAAEAAVAQQTEQARQAAATALESYGVDPTSTRYAALDIGTRTQGAAAQAAAGNTAINQTQQQGLALKAQAINMGNNLPMQSTSEYSGANSAGNSSIGNTNSTTSTGFSTMGTGAQWTGLANSSLNTAANEYNNIYNGQIQAQNQSSGWGSLAGLLGGSLLSAPSGSLGGRIGARLFANGGAVPDQAVPTGDATPGGAVPVAASPSGGRAIDDVPARLTPGEFVVPKDVVNWVGEKHLQSLIEKSRKEKPEATAQPTVQQAVPTAPAFISRPNPTGQALPLR